MILVLEIKIFFMPYKRSKTPDDNTFFFFLISKVTLKTRILPSQPQEASCIGKGNGTPLQYSCLENPMGGGAWWAAVHGVAKSQT